MDFDEASKYWEKKDSTGLKANKETILNEIDKFIMAHNTCALATGHNDVIRCTPIEYTYYNNHIYLLSEGGKKFTNLKVNNKVCLAIFDSYSGFNKIGGMQITGFVEIIEPWSSEYLEFLRFKKIPEMAFKRLDHQMYLLKIHFKEIDFLNTEFKKLGFNSRQHIDF